MVLMVTAVREAYDEYKRYKADTKVNMRTVDILLPGGQAQSCSTYKLRPGQLVRVKVGHPIPADMVVLKTASLDGDGLCYLETANLDGEADLKARRALQESNQIPVAELPTLRGRIDCDVPNNKLYSFESAMHLHSDMDAGLVGEEAGSGLAFEQAPTVALTDEQLLQAGATLRDTAWVVGVVVYTGRDTKMGMNKSTPPRKVTLVDARINRLTAFIFLFQLLLVVVLGVIGSMMHNNSGGHWYLDLRLATAQAWYQPLIIPLRFLLLNSLMIPISIRVTLDVIKAVYALLIYADTDLLDASSGTSAIASNTDTSEDLGVVSCVLTDKTGTLTDNVMHFDSCCVAGVVLPAAQLGKRQSLYASTDGPVRSDAGTAATAASAVRPATTLEQTTVDSLDDAGSVAPAELEQSVSLATAAMASPAGHRLSRRSAPLEPSEMGSTASAAQSPSREVDRAPRTSAPVRSQRVSMPSLAPVQDEEDPHTQFLCALALCNSLHPSMTSALPAGAAPERVMSALEQELTPSVAKSLAAAYDLDVDGSGAPTPTARRMRADSGNTSPIASAWDKPGPWDGQTWSCVGYTCPSPDEEALVYSAAEAGVALVNRTHLSGSEELVTLARSQVAVDARVAFLRAAAPCQLDYMRAAGDGNVQAAMARDASKKLWLPLQDKTPHDDWLILAVIPFSSARKRMAVIAQRLPAGRIAHPAWQNRQAALLGQAVIAVNPDEADEPAVRDGTESASAGRGPLSVTASSAPMSGRARRRSAYSGGEVWCFVKGADDVLLPIVQDAAGGAGAQERAVAALETFAARGLRTLVVGHRRVPEEEFKQWHATWQAASRSVTGRAEAMEQAALKMERGLTLLGVTAIEDRLQPGVPDAIGRLREAGVRFWMVTGDKYATAVQIAIASRLMQPGGIEASAQEVARFVTQSRATIPHAARVDAPGGASGGAGARQAWAVKRASRKAVVPELALTDAGPGSPSAAPLLEARSNASHSTQSLWVDDTSSSAANAITLSVRGATVDVVTAELGQAERACSISREVAQITLVIEGHALSCIVDHVHLVNSLVKVLQRADGVVACRTTPGQKAELAELAKLTVQGGNGMPQGRVLGIGDGGNDVSMILAAHVGVGISGREGLQAAHAADISVARFRYLEKLLLVHGRFAHYRTAFIAQYCFYKSAAVCLLQVAFNSACSMSGCSFLDTFNLTTYNMVYTSVPVVFFVLDQDWPIDVLLKVPKLYLQSTSGMWLSVRSALRWYARAIWHAMCVYLFVVLGFSSTWDQSTVSYTAFAALLMIVFATLVMEAYGTTRVNYAVSAICLGLFALFTTVRSFAIVGGASTLGMAQQWVHATPWLACTLAIVTALLPWIWGSCRRVSLRKAAIHKLRKAGNQD